VLKHPPHTVRDTLTFLTSSDGDRFLHNGRIDRTFGGRSFGGAPTWIHPATHVKESVPTRLFVA
jgi:hypothetical protein